MRIQHNIMAMNAYRNYNTNTSALSKNLEKLSSGYKINRAGDDAAGLAISEKMRAQITGLEAAQKNVKDGISLVKTAEGAMQEIQDMLNRMDYLATQSANGTYDDPVDRMNLQKEVNALKTEINRIADSANFNGIQLLDGSQSSSGAAGVDVSIDLKIDDAACNLGQLHEKGTTAQKTEFDIDLRQAANNLKATETIAKNATIGTFSMTIGGQTVNVKLINDGTATMAKDSAIDFNKIKFQLTDASLATGVATYTDANGNSAKLQISGITGTAGTSGILQFRMTTNATEVDFTAAMDVEISITGDADFDKEVDPTTDKTSASTYNCNTQNVQNGYALKNDQLAHGEFKFTKEMATALAGGGELKIGDQTIKFDVEKEYGSSTLGATGAVDKDGKVTSYGANTIGVKDLLDGDGNIKVDDASLAEMVARISRAAGGTNTVFTVGAGHDDTTISLTEKRDYYDANVSTKNGDGRILNTAEKFKGMLSCTSAGSGGSGGLTLQIGDTADSYNRLTVSIGDMHTSAMKSATSGQSIADVDISNQSGAQEAIQTIRDAINYVSSVRGDLGATQNRLEHTANNLSVMAENIQDAESTIRDTDIAEEMMAYTKNNILVQSAQAMLAQANAVPQGVLQLLG